MLSSAHCKSGWPDPSAIVWGEMGTEVENILENVFSFNS